MGKKRTLANVIELWEAGFLEIEYDEIPNQYAVRMSQPEAA
jgi:hypothetical protein